MTEQALLLSYDGLPAEAALDARLAADRIKLRLKRTSEDIIAIGQELIAIKPKLAGHFEKWWEAETGLSTRMAYRFIDVAERMGHLTNCQAELPAPSILYELSKPSTPDDVRQEVLDRSADGEKTTVAEVRRLRAEALEALEQAERAADDAASANSRLDAEIAAGKTLSAALHKARAETEAHKAAKGQFQERSKALAAEVAALKAQLDRKPREIRVEVEKEAPPPGFTSIEEAITAKTAEQAELDGQLAAKDRELKKLGSQLDRLNSEKARLEREARLAESQAENAERKRAKLANFRGAIAKVLADHQEAELLLASDVITPLIRSEICAIADRLAALSDVCRRLSSTVTIDEQPNAVELTLLPRVGGGHQ